MLVVTTGLIGFPPPTLMERFDFAVQWAGAAEAGICVAVVARPEMIDPHKFGVTVARNRGLIADVFTSEADALAWLESLQ